MLSEASELPVPVFGEQEYPEDLRLRYRFLDLRRERFPVKFYLVAMLFIVFDIETAFMYPWAVAYDELKIFGLIEMGVFLAILFAAYVYVWKRGGLEWAE